MELTLTPEQTKYLNKHSPIKADALKRIYKKSVQDQQKTLKAAAKIRKSKQK
jgi:hypothetical protein